MRRAVPGEAGEGVDPAAPAGVERSGTRLAVITVKAASPQSCSHDVRPSSRRA